MVDEQEVGGDVLAHGGGVLLDEAAALVGGQLLHVGGLEIGVAVEDEDGQPRVDRGPDDARGAEVVAGGIGVLAEDDHLVPEPAPGACQRSGVDVRPRSAQEVAVPEENLHAWMILTDLS